MNEDSQFLASTSTFDMVDLFNSSYLMMWVVVLNLISCKFSSMLVMLANTRALWALDVIELLIPSESFSKENVISLGQVRDKVEFLKETPSPRSNLQGFLLQCLGENSGHRKGATVEAFFFFQPHTSST